jgi:DNA polymerase I-like protein with 3'-5' exonuclease and polymerase domains
MAARLAAEGLWDYFDVVEAPFTAVLRDMECEGLPVDLVATAQLEKMYLAASTQLQQELTQDLPACFNIRSPKQVALLLGSARFTLPDKQPRSEARELDETLDELAGVETNLETVDPGSFITNKRGRLYDHGVWVCAGLGIGTGGFNTPLKSVARPDLLGSSISSTPWVTDYLTFKKYDKLVGTYLQVFQEKAEGGRVYARFNQTGTVTGRLSSAGPNLQNIPSRGATGESVRRLITGNLVVGDFSQLEPRLMAHFSQDPKMLAVFNEGRDIYEDIATNVGCTRDVAKVLVLAMGYGAGAEKVAGILTINGYPTRLGDAQRLLKKLREEYIVYFAWREETILMSKTAGYVETLDGRKRRLSGTRDLGHAFWKDPSAPGRQAANAVVQGSAADVVRRVMLHTDKLFPDLRLLAQVHDELVWEYDPPLPPGELDRLEKWVTRVAQRGVSVPLLFEPHLGPNWYDAKSGEWLPTTPEEDEDATTP